MTERKRRAIARRPHAEATSYTEPDGEIPGLDSLLDTYVNGQMVSDGQTVLWADVEDDEVTSVEVRTACASQRARQAADEVTVKTVHIDV